MLKALRNTHDSDQLARMVERAQCGDDKAFMILYRTYSRYVAGVVYRFIGYDEEIDDIVQETFVGVAKGIRKLENPEQLRPWIVKIAIRAAHRHLKRRVARQEVMTDYSADGDVGAVTSHERIQEILNILENLPLKLRIPWMLHRVEEMTIPEVSYVCGRSPATVKRRIAKAEQIIKGLLDVD